MTVERPTEHQVLAAVGSIGAATLASRVLGFVRDMVVALAFGAGPVTDAFFVAYRIPNLLRRLLAEGALSTAVVPVFADYAATRSREEFLRMERAVLGAALLALVGTTAAGIAWAPWLLRVIAPGLEDGQAALAVVLTRVMFPYLVLVGLAALATGALNTFHRFFASALGPAIANVGMIVGVVLVARWIEPPVVGLAIGVLIGGAGAILVQVPSLLREGLLVWPATELSHPALRRVARLLLPSVFGLAAVQVTVFVNTLLASLLAPGSISFLYYADRVMEFPLGVFAVALASASLPAMSRQAAARDLRAVASTLNFTVRMALTITVPATVGLVLLRTPITRVLFERGRFGPDDTVATAQALLWYAVGLVGFSLARIVAQAFYALGEADTAVKLGLVAVGANVVAAVVLMGPLAHGGLALASSLAAYVNGVLLLWVARRRLGGLGGRAIAASAARATLASAPLAAWCALALWAWPTRPQVIVDVAWLAITLAGGAALFAASCRVLAPREFAALRGILPLGRRR